MVSASGEKTTEDCDTNDKGGGDAAVYGLEGSFPSEERERRQSHDNPRYWPQQQQRQQHEQYQDQGAGQKLQAYSGGRRQWIGHSDAGESGGPGTPPTKTGELHRLFEETFMKLLKEEEEEEEAGGEAAAVSPTRRHAVDEVEPPRVGWVHVVRRISALSVGDIHSRQPSALSVGDIHSRQPLFHVFTFFRSSDIVCSRGARFFNSH